MDKNTVIAVILSVIVIFGGFYLQNTLFKPDPAPLPEPGEAGLEEISPSTPVPVAAGSPGEEAAPEEEPAEQPLLPQQQYPLKDIVVDTDLYGVTFSTAGGVVTRLDLKEHSDKDRPVPMILDQGGEGAFNVAFGGVDAPFIKEVFAYEKAWDGKAPIHKFSRDFVAGGTIFTLTKEYRFIDGEYLFLLSIILETADGSPVPVNIEGNLYTLSYGPQFGPSFTKLDGRNEYRRYVSLANDGRKGQSKKTNWKLKSGSDSTGQLLTWAAIVGKYFTVMVTPGTGDHEITWDNREKEGVPFSSQLHLTRFTKRSSRIETAYRWYLGPKDPKVLARYNDSTQNSYRISGLQLDQVLDSSNILGWLEAILKFLLEIFYKMIPNYGVAILLLTVVVKAALFPFTHKSYESTSKMQAIQPKIKELQAKHKGDAPRLNKEMSELYKKEGVNPMGGCLPLLLQMPIFFALYGLLNKYFPLRGAAFIPGWITDLSAPEAILTFEPVNLVIWEISAIRLLPVLYLGGQLLMTKITQGAQSGTQTGMQQKFMTIGMPIMFFFILYNMPSGLLLYWTAMNVITIVQQLVTNNLKKRKASGGKK